MKLSAETGILMGRELSEGVALLVSEIQNEITEPEKADIAIKHMLATIISPMLDDEENFAIILGMASAIRTIDKANETMELLKNEEYREELEKTLRILNKEKSQTEEPTCECGCCHKII